MPIKNIGVGQLGYTIDPLKYVPISDTWSVASFGTGYAVLSSDNSTGSAVSALVQGEFLSSGGAPLVVPTTFGGITPNNDANQYAQVTTGQYNVTTTMPNQQAPLVNYVYCDGTFVVEVLYVIDDNNIVVKDPSGITQASSGYTLTGFSANSYPIRNISVYNDSTSSCLLWLPGQPYITLNAGTVQIEPNSYGECTPVMVQCQAGTTVLTYNE